MNVFAFVFKILFGLVPPSIWKFSKGARLAPKSHMHYRENRGIDRDIFVWEVFVSLTSIVAIGFGLTSMGLLPFMGNGFAHAGDQKATQKQVVATRQEQLEWRMFDLRVKQCEAIRRGESPRAYTTQLAQQVVTYRELVGKEPTLPKCEEL